MKKTIIVLLLIASGFMGFGQVQYGTGNTSITGNITTQNLNPLTGVPTAGSFVRLTLANQSTATIAVSGTYTGVLSVQFTTDGGTTWVTYTNANLLTAEVGATKTATIASAAVGIFTMDCAGLSDIRVSSLAAVTGTAVITIKAVTGSQQVGFGEPLPAGANVIGNVGQNGTWTAMIGNTANTTPVLANPLIPVGTTTGDVGAKTATGNGATQTNVNATGATILVNMGAVTGTTPTAVLKLQGSTDAGTTWYDITGATTASLTVTGIYVIQVYPGLTAVAGTATTGSVAMINGIIPRTWRVVWTIGGTTPSFTLTNIQINYTF